MTTVQLPTGTADYLGSEVRQRAWLKQLLRSVFESYGGVEVETPILEQKSLLTSKYGDEADKKEMYFLKDQGGEPLALRYDLTVPFARLMGMNGLEEMKRYQLGDVFRRDRPQPGRMRQFVQCDFDLAGTYQPMVPETELMMMIDDVMTRLGVDDYQVRVNSRPLLDALLEEVGVEVDRRKHVLTLIDKLDKKAWSEIEPELGLTEIQVKSLKTLLTTEETCPAFEAGFAPIRLLQQYLAGTGVASKIVVDRTMVRGLDYYTGLIFEVVITGCSSLGTVVAGGRYDGLIGQFRSKACPCVGISFGFERLMLVCRERGLFPVDQMREKSVVVTSVGKSTPEMIKYKVSVASAFRRAGWQVELHMKNKVDLLKLFQKYEGRYARIAIVGESEVEAGTVTLKRMNDPTDKGEMLKLTEIK